MSKINSLNQFLESKILNNNKLRLRGYKFKID